MNISNQIATLPAFLEEKKAYQYIALAAIVLLAFAFRFYKLGQWSFWVDEIATIRRATAHILEAETIKFWRQPPSLFLIAAALGQLGVNEWSARVGPAIIGVVTIPVLYFPIRRMAGPLSALIASLLLAVAPWHIFWSQNARFYSSLFLLYSLAYFAFYFALEEDRSWLMPLSLILMFLAFRERVFAVFFVPVAASYVVGLKLFRFKLPPGFNKKNLLLFFAPIIAYLVLTLFLFATGGNPPIVDSLRMFWGNPIDDPARILILVAFNIGLAVVTLAFFGGFYFLLDKDRWALYLLIGAVLPPLLLAAANPFFFTVDRYVFMSLISWLVLAAITLSAILSLLDGRASLLAIGILAMLLMESAGAHLMYYQLNNGNRLDWRAALQTVDEQRLDGENVVTTREIMASFYLGEETIDLTKLNVTSLEQLPGKTWFVVDSEGMGAVGPLAREWLEENGDLIDLEYLRVRETINLKIYSYEPETGND